MALYEVTVLFRPDIAVAQIRDAVEELRKALESKEGSLEVAEYCGFRTLSYRIKKRMKAHYVSLVVSAENESLKELQYWLRFSRDVVRSLSLRTEREHLKVPSPLFQSPLFGGDEIVIGAEEPGRDFSVGRDFSERGRA